MSSAKPRKKTKHQLLIEALVKDAEQPPGAPAVINWQLEMKFLRELLKKQPDTDFWFWFGKSHKYPTLMYLLSDYNDTSIINGAFIRYTKEKKLEIKTPEPSKVGTKKVGKDIILPQKPKTLFDFINNV